MRRRWPGIAVCAAIALGQVACRSTAEPSELEIDSAAALPLRIVVAPMNLALPLSPDLVDAVEPVGDELVGYLQALGARVAVIWEADASALWRQAAAAFQEQREDPPDFLETAGVFSRLLAREAEFDLLVLPSLVFRDAEVNGRFAEWDGVRRRIRFRATPAAPRGRAQTLPDPFDSTARSGLESLTPDWRGRITGLSLHAIGLTPQGGGVFQGLGGLDLVHDAVRPRSGSAAEPPILRLQTNLLDDRERVREGIALALSPFIASGIAP